MEANVKSDMRARWPYIVAFVFGAVVWVLVAANTDRSEAWDSPLYFSYAMPALMLAGLVLGLVAHEGAWRWGLMLFVGQAAMAFVRDPTANLLPLGLIAFGVLSIPTVLCALGGARIRRMYERRAGRAREVGGAAPS